MKFDPRALSTFLAFRWLVDPRLAWTSEIRPSWPEAASRRRFRVADTHDIEITLRAVCGSLERNTGLLLSAGMDSAILAALMPQHTIAFTVEFDAPGARSEAPDASLIARKLGLRHEVVRVTWSDYERWTVPVARHKQAPLHPVEVGLFLAARAARDTGLTRLVVGNGADSNFGGLDKLLSRNWTVRSFAQRYCFVDPARVLVSPTDVMDVFERFDRGDGSMDVPAFLREVHGPGITQAFQNALSAAGIEMIEPYEMLELEGGLDLHRIRHGESKYLLRSLFRHLFGFDAPDKLPFIRPMDTWMSVWDGPHRPELRPDTGPLTGEQRWLVWCLERFLDALEEG